jgi:hypothetical protein
MGRKKTVLQEPRVVRRCANIKSKKLPDVRCSSAATQGEFCTRHSKNPHRFQEKQSLERTYSLSEIYSAARIQSWWMRLSSSLRLRRQGSLVHIPSLAENTTDMFTLDPVSEIPLLYRWSYKDTKDHRWIFDIRSLSMSSAHGNVLSNPYTREPISGAAEIHFHERCTWLRSKKYCLVQSNGVEMTPEQEHQQKILDVIMKYDALGYHICIGWFEELCVADLSYLYRELWDLWYYRLQLSTEIRNQVVPDWDRQTTLVFKWRPSELRSRHDLRWWQKISLELLDRFVSSASLKEHRTLGALYGMTALVIVSPTIRDNYPWLVEFDG